MSNPLEMPINDEARDEAHVASTGGRLCKHKKQNEDLVMHHKMKWDSCWDSFEIWLRNSIERP